jgi:hypothetical protein
MAELLNERQLENEIAALEALEIKDKAEEPAQPSEELPEKYRNKSLQDIVRMHQEAEKAMGRQANEVGELRKAVDDLITKQTELVIKKEPVKEVDFFSDPEGAVSQTIEKHPAFQELRSLTQKQKQATAQAEMLRRHPDAHELLVNEGFLNWIGSSKVRQALLLRADKEYDVDAADELFSLWKERQGLVNQAATSEQTSRKETVRRAASGNNNVAAEPQPKKKFRRQDIITLMKDDPDRYAALAAEIRQAYAEKRVIN